MPTDDYEPTEIWNMAQAFLKRVDDLLWECKNNRGYGHFDEWYKSLDSLYVETSSKLKEKIGSEINKSLRELAPLAARFQINNGKLPDKEIGELALNLRKIDILIHKALDEKGLLTPLPQDARKAILG